EARKDYDTHCKNLQSFRNENASEVSVKTMKRALAEDRIKKHPTVKKPRLKPQHALKRKQFSQRQRDKGLDLLHIRDSGSTQSGSGHVLGLGIGSTRLGIGLGSVRPSGSGRSVEMEVGSCDFNQSPVITFMPRTSPGLRSSCYFHLKAQVYLGPGAP